MIWINLCPARNTPTTTFETYPFPWPPGQEPAENEDERVAAIAQAARELVTFRQAWLHPEGVGITISEKVVKKRTLTNLYNALTDYREQIKGQQRSPGQWDKVSPKKYLKKEIGASGII